MKYLINLIKKFRIGFSIIVILLISLLIRVLGIYFDYPNLGIIIWDESPNVSFLADIISQQKIPPFPTSLSYPSLFPILLFPIFIFRILYLAFINNLDNISEIKNFLISDGLGQVYIIARWYAVIFGVLSTYLIYRITYEISNKKLTAYLAAFAYTFSLVPLVMAHWGKSHVPMVFFVLLSLFFALKFEKNKKNVNLYLSFISAASALSIHYIGVTAIIFPLAGIYYNWNFLKKRDIFWPIIIYFFIGSVFYGINYYGFRFMLIDMFEHYYKPNNFLAISSTGNLERYYYVLRDSWKVEPIFISLLLVALFRLKENWKNNGTKYIVIGMAFNYFLMVTIIVGAHLSRWLLSFISLAIIFSSINLIELLENLKFKKSNIALICFIIIIPSVSFSCRWLGLLKNNTLIEAQEWCEKNVERSDKIYSYSDRFTLPLSYDSALWNYNNNLKYKMQRKITFILENKERFLGKGRNVYYDDKNMREELKQAGMNYIIIEHNQIGIDDFLNSIINKNNAVLLRSFFPSENLKPEIEVLNNPGSWADLMKIKKSGPYLDVYKINI